MFKRATLMGAIILLVMPVAGLFASPPPRQLILKSGEVELADVPVLIELPEEFINTESLRLTDTESGTIVDVQRAQGRSAVFILNTPLPAGDKRVYQLEQEDSSLPSPSVVRSEQTDGFVQVRVREQPVLNYHTAVVEPPEGVDPKYRRSGHIHPVYTPTGKIVTDEFPSGHIHQHALFAAWVNTEFQGRRVDFWNQHLGTGTVEHRRLIQATSGPVFGNLLAELAYVDLSAPEGRLDALHETWLITVYGIKTGHLFQIDSLQKCASSDPLLLKEYHYGGMALRGAAQWQKNPDFSFTTSAGDDRKSGNHTRPRWVTLQGPVEGGRCTITMFCDPGNERDPQPIRLHPNFPYCVYSPVVLGDREITADRPYRSRYWFYVTDGPVEHTRLQQIRDGMAASLGPIAP